MLKLYNSLTKQKEEFVPLNDPEVSFYTCGPTVYHFMHIGHIKKYVGDDLIKRSLNYLGYKVTHVQNVTDVGHLTSDADEGEDKLEKGARIHGVDIWDLAESMTNDFYNTLDKVNVIRPNVIMRATSDEAIAKQLDMIEKLIQNGFAYISDKAIYFDVQKLPDYNPFSNQPVSDKINGAREEVVMDPEKRSPADFALWIFTKGIHKNHIMRWKTSWGEGFPGWHIECSAIGTSQFGDHIDIHTGGVDHLSIHHPNEIAQNFGVYQKRVVSVWVHHEFLTVDGEKMSKSKNNFYQLQDLIDRGFSPLDLRYLILGAHYRKQLNFTWESLDSAKTTRNNLREKVMELNKPGLQVSLSDLASKYKDSFDQALEDDINIPQALAIAWKLIKSDISDQEKCLLMRRFDTVFGLGLFEDNKGADLDIPSEIRELARERAERRLAKDFEAADRLRKQIISAGYNLVDQEDGSYKIVAMRKH